MHKTVAIDHTIDPFQVEAIIHIAPFGCARRKSEKSEGGLRGGVPYT
jgi:hypothetical protein